MISDNVMYNYSNTTIYKNQYANSLNKNDLNEQFIKVSFTNSKDTANPSFIINNNKYVTRNLYVLNKNHNIQGIEYDGELIIEHAPITNGEKSYLCILLQTNPTIKETAIDKIINNSFKDNLELNINELLLSINNKECIGNPAKNVYIFKQPIQVNSRFDNFIINSPILFPKYKKEDYHTIRISAYSNDTAVESFVEGIDDVFDCNLIDASTDTISTITTPIGGSTTQKSGEMEFVKTSSNFVTFFLFLCVVLIIIPIIYIYLIVEPVKKIADSLYFTMLTVDYCLLVVSFLIILLCMTSENIIIKTSGIYIALIFVISLIEIKLLKMYASDKFGVKPLANETPNNGNVFLNVFKFLAMNPIFFLLKNSNFFISLFFLGLLVSLQIFFMYFTGNGDKIRSIFASSGNCQYWFILYIFTVAFLFLFDLNTTIN